MITIDARGKACPTPVIMTKNAVAENPDKVEVTVDNPEALQNVTRFLKSKGYAATSTERGKDYVITGVRTEAAESCAPAETLAAKLPNAVFLSHDKIGGDDAELGEVLMKAFLGTLAQFDEERPEVVALMNEGVKLSVRGTPSCESLQDYVDKGGRVLVCGTCLKHFALTDKIGVGTVSNMFEIVSTLLKHNTVTL
ncbi:MAG: sulfurtransferase-like selenium metabolism protein YedF [Pyramidobacter sp.]